MQFKQFLMRDIPQDMKTIVLQQQFFFLINNNFMNNKNLISTI